MKTNKSSSTNKKRRIYFGKTCDYPIKRTVSRNGFLAGLHDRHNIDYALENGFLGITTSPTLTPRAINAEPEYWTSLMRKYMAADPRMNEFEILWKCMYEVSSIRAQKLLGIYEPDGFSGRFCIQGNVFDYMNADKIITQSREIHSLGKNFIMKIATTEAGLRAMEEVIASGHSAMATAISTVSQVEAAAQALERGMERRRKLGLSTEGIVMSVAMQFGLPEQCYRTYAAQNHLKIREEALDMSTVAVAKKAYFLLREKYPDIYFVLSNFKTEYHWREFLGGKIMLTIPRRILPDLEACESFENRIDIPVPSEYTEELLEQIPFYRNAYEEGALQPKEFTGFEGFRQTIRKFTEEYAGGLATVREVMLPNPCEETEALEY